MPATERVTAPRWRLPWQRRMWPTVAGVVGLALVAVALFTLSLTLPSRPTCTGTVVSIAARMQAAPDREPGRLRDPARRAEQEQPGQCGRHPRQARDQRAGRTRRLAHGQVSGSSLSSRS